MPKAVHEGEDLFCHKTYKGMSPVLEAHILQTTSKEHISVEVEFTFVSAVADQN